MAEPIPSASNDTEDTAPTNAEDRKAAAALDSLNANAMSQENGEGSGAKQPTAADQEALGKAMARLEGVAGGKGGAKKVESKDGAKGVVSKKKEEDVKKKVKVDAGDVQFLVSELDLTKAKATDLLRAHDGVLDSVVKTFVVPGIKA